MYQPSDTWVWEIRFEVRAHNWPKSKKQIQNKDKQHLPADTAELFQAFTWDLLCERESEIFSSGVNESEYLNLSWSKEWLQDLKHTKNTIQLQYLKPA